MSDWPPLSEYPAIAGRRCGARLSWCETFLAKRRSVSQGRRKPQGSRYPRVQVCGPALGRFGQMKTVYRLREHHGDLEAVQDGARYHEHAGWKITHGLLSGGGRCRSGANGSLRLGASFDVRPSSAMQPPR